MASGLGLYRPHPTQSDHALPGWAPGRSLRPDREGKREDDFRLSCFDRTVDRVTFPEARDSSNFPKLEYITMAVFLEENKMGQEKILAHFILL
jgi:hypothetical protein